MLVMASAHACAQRLMIALGDSDAALNMRAEIRFVRLLASLWPDTSVREETKIFVWVKVAYSIPRLV